MYNIEFADIDASEEIFTQLSEFDKKCVGADGWSAESFKSEVQKDNGYVLYISDNENIIALLSGYSAIGEGDVTSVAVAPEYRRKGLAQALINEFIKHLPDDTENIFLEVRESNEPAIKLYEKCGFEKLSVRKNFYANPRENAIVMCKEVGKSF